jgi:uncharacterized membrane protein (UPF0127 family)
VNPMIPKNPLYWQHFGKISTILSSGLVLALGFCVLWSQAAEPVVVPPAAIAIYVDKPQTGLPERTLTVGAKTYRVEVASTPQQEQTGLMFRTRLPQGHGMLFPFNPPRPVRFWMKNTKIGLDMLFVANGRLLQVFENACPCVADPCKSYGLSTPVDMVVELPAGTAHRDHLLAGDLIQVDLADIFNSNHVEQPPVSEKGK